MAFTGIKTACVIVAHADDEILGCGGTMARLSEQGTNVHVAFMTDGIGARANSSADLKSEREEMAQKANRIVGSASIDFAGFPDNAMDSVPLLDITRHVESVVARYQPELIITHSSCDLNIDHQRTFRAVMTACRPQPGHCVKTILSAEIASATNWSAEASAHRFSPNLFVDITRQLDRKMEALKAYAVEMRDFPHTRSLEALEARTRVCGTDVGVKAAEAFTVVRQII
ncbi:PIG-L deacetylase family protein [Kiloniella sp. b19]|uniref:PIG-L deacetylase family protein n=1 Tax=Kiloniella sp. GXU_MW_B19 TaxID=3141326 RepID=UPI0031E344FC